MSDELDGIFDNLTPDQFDRETSAVLTTDSFHIGHFEAFLAVQLHAARVAFEAADGVPNPVAIMENGKQTRIFAPEDDELMAHYVQRLAREAVSFGTKRLFISLITEAARQPMPPHLNPAEAVTYAREHDLMEDSIAWFAEEINPNPHRNKMRCGMIEIVAGHTGEVIEANPADAADLFLEILADLR